MPGGRLCLPRRGADPAYSCRPDDGSYCDLCGRLSGRKSAGAQTSHCALSAGSYLQGSGNDSNPSGIECHSEIPKRHPQGSPSSLHVVQLHEIIQIDQEYSSRGTYTALFRGARFVSSAGMSNLALSRELYGTDTRSAPGYKHYSSSCRNRNRRALRLLEASDWRSRDRQSESFRRNPGIPVFLDSMGL